MACAEITHEDCAQPQRPRVSQQGKASQETSTTSSASFVFYQNQYWWLRCSQVAQSTFMISERTLSATALHLVKQRAQGQALKTGSGVAS